MARFTFADEPFECCCETILATNVFCRKRYPSQKAPIKWMQNNIHLPETPSFQIFKLAFCQNFAQTSTNILIFILKHGPMGALISYWGQWELSFALSNVLIGALGVELWPKTCHWLLFKPCFYRNLVGWNQVRTWRGSRTSNFSTGTIFPIGYQQIESI